jgi:RND family efflux transporter MFP subunit
MRKINLNISKQKIYMLISLVFIIVLFTLIVLNKNSLKFFNKKESTIVVEKPKVPKKVIPVSVYEAKLDNLEVVEKSVGIVYNLDSSKISAETSGVVNKVYVEIGDKIQKGQVLAEIDKKELINSRNTQNFEIKKIDAQLKDQEKNLIRYKKLYKEGYVSQSELDTIQTNVSSLRQQLSSAKSTLANYNISIEKSTIKSTISGVLQERLISSGTFASVGTHLFTIVDNSSVLILVNYPEFFSGVIKKDQKVIINLSDSNSLISKIKDIKPIIEEDTRSLQAIVAIANNSYKLKPGGTVNVSVVVDNKFNILLIPQDAIVLRAVGKVVYIVNQDGNSVEERLISVGSTSGGMIEITKGLKENEKVVVVGAGFLSNGANINITK